MPSLGQKVSNRQLKHLVWDHSVRIVDDSGVIKSAQHLMCPKSTKCTSKRLLIILGKKKVALFSKRFIRLYG